jgi:hypothetical protein
MLASTKFRAIAENVPEWLDALPLQTSRRNLKFPVRGGRSSMVELQIVVLVVAGSSPVGHPAFASLRRR